MMLRGSSSKGSRTAQSAMYTEELCNEYITVMVPDATSGGRSVNCKNFKAYNL